ncbi:MAG TPA: hypothetical protein VJ672_09465 [Gemmatimonadaceae bacterium]|nr:hypothetical protein [Gemmatimonadaceae bacterium]
MCAELVAHEPVGTARHYATIVIVGGGCYGSYYLRQLRRAREAGAISVEHVLVVDRHEACAVAAIVDAALGERVERAEWSSFFAHYLAHSADDDSTSADAIVPSPLMPHLMFEWLLQRARERWPDRAVHTRPLARPPSMPWQQAAPDGTHYVSFAEWTCPINCIEPPLCPEISGPRTWSMPPALRAYVDAERARGHPLIGPLIFHCEHRAYGVGMFDTAAVIEADRRIAREAAGGPSTVLVGTVSHCHGALNVMAIGA